MDSKIIGNRLKILIEKKQIKRKELAKNIGISYNTLTRKLNGHADFSALEISKIKYLLELDDKFCANLFFNPNFKIDEDKAG